jgi:hypothetical protein
MVCIYCLKEKSEAGFNKDHVIPRCFGSFEPNNFTLINCVCSECNQFFGDTLEISLGRDSLEGVTRYNYSIFPSGKSIFRRLVFRIEREGPLKGMLVSPKPRLLDGLPEIDLLDQVGFFSTKTGQYEFFPAAAIPEKDQLLKDGYSFSEKEIRIIGNYEELQEILTIMGFPNKFLSEEALFKSAEDKKNIPVYIKARIDRTIARGMAKIGFNYLAHITNKAFVLGRDFESIRRFIRYDEGDYDELFRVDKKPILRKEIKFRNRILDGHIVVVEWHDDDFRLSKNYSGIWIPIFNGHYFDVAQNLIRPLHNIKKLIVPDSF